MDLDIPTEFEYFKMMVDVAKVDVPEIVVPEDKQIILREMRFHYLDWGDNGRTPILFLHGGGLNAHTWDAVCLSLRKDYYCLALDQRGHGDSEWSPVMDYSRETQVGDIEALVDSLGLDRFILVGMSLGGMNSLGYAALHSDRLRALAIVDVGPDIRVKGVASIHDFTAAPAELDSLEEFVQRAVTFNPLRDPRLLRRSLLYNVRPTPNGKLTWKYDRRHRVPWTKSTEGDHQPSLGRAVTLHKDKMTNHELWEAVPSINCPTLVVQGEKSDVFYEEDADKLSQALPDGRWVQVPGAGHTVQGDNPRDLVAELRKFFAEVGV